MSVDVVTFEKIVRPKHRHQATCRGMFVDSLIPVRHLVFRVLGYRHELGPGVTSIARNAQAGTGLARRRIVVLLPVLVRLAEGTIGKLENGAGTGPKQLREESLHDVKPAPGTAFVAGGGVQDLHRKQPLSPGIDKRQLRARAIDPQE